jgi:hypothetical protein
MNSGFDLAKVVGIHPGGYAIDVIMYPDGSRVSNVQVMSGQASNNSGVAGLRDPGKTADAEWTLDDTGDGDQIAIIGLIHGLPVCLGFLFPQVSQMLFSDIDREIRRHASDWYESIDSAGNYEMYHPSGTYLRIGSSPAHEDLTGKDFDGRWDITKNTGSAPYVHLSVANAGAKVSSVDFDPQGNVTLENNGDLTANVGGNATATVQKKLTATAAAIEVNGPTTINGDTLINGATTLNGPMSQGAGSNGGTANVAGTMNVGTDVVIAGKSTVNHDHSDPQGGTTGPMQN